MLFKKCKITGTLVHGPHTITTRISMPIPASTSTTITLGNSTGTGTVTAITSVIIIIINHGINFIKESINFTRNTRRSISTGIDETKDYVCVRVICH